jgi:hypothetical protein
LQNTGRIPILNLKVWLEGDGFPFGQSTEQIFGHMASGGFNYYNTTFMAPFIPGSYMISIMVQYDLDNGRRILEEYELPLFVFDTTGWDDPWDDPWGPGNNPGRPPGNDPEPIEDEPLGWWGRFNAFMKDINIFLLIGGGLAVAFVTGAATYGIIRVKRRRREDFDLDE